MMKRIYIFLLAFLASANVWSQDADVIVGQDTVAPDSVILPWPQSMTAEIDSLLTDELFNTSQLGMMIFDLTADSVLYYHDERQRLRPASTLKLLTAITALDQLGGDYQFKTSLRYVGEIKDSTLTGDLYCVGGFDPRFNTDDMTAFVETLRELGVDTIRGTIYADKSMKGPEPYGEGWCWDDDNPVLSPLLINGHDMFMDRFLTKLSDAGIKVNAMLSEGKCPSDALNLCHRFHTIDQILMRMMKESDNLYAESMFYQIAARSGDSPGTAKSAARCIKQLIEKIGLNSNEYNIADGSGLSLYNYVTAELETLLLRYAYLNSNIYFHLRPSLPEAGADGTLKSRMQDNLTRGRVFAKTGSVTGVSSLAGYCISGNGHLLAFSIINQGVRRVSIGRDFQDKVCAAMCR